MKRGISSNTRRELIGALSERYRQTSRIEKGRILDEFVKLTKCHRKYAIRLLNQGGPSMSISVRPSRRIYDEAVREALVAIWEAADRICGKRLRIIVSDKTSTSLANGEIRQRNLETLLDQDIEESGIDIHPGYWRSAIL